MKKDQVEVWKKVPRGYPYEVSSMGRVRSLPRVIVNSRCTRSYKGKILKPTPISGGYLSVDLQEYGKPNLQITVHRLVAITFLGKPPFPAAMALHGDDDRTNNSVRNLRWGTHQDNMDDKTARDRCPKGSSNGNVTLDEGQVLRIAKLIVRGSTQVSIAQKFGITQATVSLIKTGKTWSHITGFTKHEKRTG